MQDIINLLEAYKSFTEQSDSRNLEKFGAWLVAREKQSPNFDSSGLNEVDSHGINAMVSYLMGGLIGYAEAWLKLSFRELPVVSFIDFGILKTVEGMGNPSKKEIADNIIAERTTTVESIKRMVGLGLLRDKEDKDDKRIRRVSLTEKGKKMVFVLNEKMLSLGNLLVGDLTLEEKNQLGHLLRKLNHFHGKLYKEKDRMTIRNDFAL